MDVRRNSSIPTGGVNTGFSRGCRASGIPEPKEKCANKVYTIVCKAISTCQLSDHDYTWKDEYCHSNIADAVCEEHAPRNVI